MPILPVESILTLEERDRRWKNIREEMKKRGLDCLIVWGSQGYWTGIPRKSSAIMQGCSVGASTGLKLKSDFSKLNSF